MPGPIPNRLGSPESGRHTSGARATVPGHPNVDLHPLTSSLELWAPEQAHGRAPEQVQGGGEGLKDELDNETSQEDFAMERHRLTHSFRSVMVNTFCERQYSKVLSICIRKTLVGGLTAML